MGRPTVVEVNYYDFKNELKRAATEGQRIEPKEKDRWKTYVKEKKILEASCLSIARGRFEDARPVIIDSGGDWDGFYIYSSDDQVCLKFQRDGE
ncbi:MAG: hypothetical protein HKN21_10585 [Candidatus Eisenbacteria bacterium]|uniref:Uncharacterized protein n=1 Tax=Eiseniibacteriota bacterium TaxID=2212470 RepID=A0A7Y2E9S2_UNCEI|nr:hypothetical protein [Candidatus Eisenbacteria bacterium]